MSNEIDLTIDVEAINLDDLERTGAIEYYRESADLPRPGTRGCPPLGETFATVAAGCHGEAPHPSASPAVTARYG